MNDASDFKSTGYVRVFRKIFDFMDRYYGATDDAAIWKEITENAENLLSDFRGSSYEAFAIGMLNVALDELNSKAVTNYDEI